MHEIQKSFCFILFCFILLVSLGKNGGNMVLKFAQFFRELALVW